MRIVIVDAVESDRRLIEKMLRATALKSGCSIAGMAENGIKGRELIGELQPDLVITDLSLPKMNGISMLRKLRAEQIRFRVLIITAEQDFNKIRQAIGLGIDDYLLKPVKKAQFQRALLNIEEKLISDQVMRGALSPESVFSGCMNGRVHSDEQINRITLERYGFTLNDEGAVFIAWLGNGYTENRERVRNILQDEGAAVSRELCVLSIDVWRLVVGIVYGKHSAESEKDSYGLFSKKIMPVLSKEVSGELVCMWSETERLENVLEVLKELYRIREWNLLFDRGTLIRRQDIEMKEIVPLKYPADIEDQLRHAVIASDAEEIKKSYYKLYERLRQSFFSPREIKECLIRINMAVLTAYKTCHEIKSELRLHRSMQGITEAISWGEIRTAMEEFFDGFDLDALKEIQEERFSPLIRKAILLMDKYYTHGITLEEMAEQLFVSEEYLSAQFKKETGYGFKETVRKKQIEKIKELLANTHLKLNQIAELTGYNDPKYMSRVFKEEVGMLPTEFRKEVH